MILTHLTNTKIIQLEWRCDWVTHLYRVDRTESPLWEALFPSLRTILGVLEEVQQIPKKQQSNGNIIEPNASFACTQGCTLSFSSSTELIFLMMTTSSIWSNLYLEPRLTLASVFHFCKCKITSTG